MVTNGDIYHLGMTNIAMERSTIFKFGKPSTSIRAIYTMAMLNNHMVPSGKLTKLWKITIFNGKIYYKWPFFNSYVKLPDGNSPRFIKTSSIKIITANVPDCSSSVLPWRSELSQNPFPGPRMVPY